MLRGINVSGQKIVRMEHLRESCKRLGFQNVETYVQSGNIIFWPPRHRHPLFRGASAKEFSATLASRTCLHQNFKEMGDVIKVNPLLKEKGIDLSKLHVTFLSELRQSALSKLTQLPTQILTGFHVVRQGNLPLLPWRMAATQTLNTALEKALSVGATTRNWKNGQCLI
jgi:uncharacterized protein (DUF1697 family)